MKTCIVSSFVFLLSTAGLAQDFKASTQKGVDLKKYETFTIEQGEVVVSEDTKIDKDQLFKDFKRVTLAEMKGRGYKYVEDSTAQLVISYVVETSRVVESENVGPLGQMPQRNAGDVQTQTWSRDFMRGSLIMSMEAGKNNLVWTAEGTIDGARTRGGNALEYAIKSALDDFPNRNKKTKKKKNNKKD
jgi:hypothetical protein